MVAVAVMIGSFRNTVQYWTRRNAGRRLVRVFSLRSGQTAGLYDCSRSSPVASSDHPGDCGCRYVSAGERRVSRCAHRSGIRALPTLLDHGNLLVKSPSNWRTALRQAIGRDAVIVTEPFALKHGHDVGDEIQLPTTNGLASFRIAGVYFDYSSDRGMVVFDRSTFVRHFGDRPPTSLTVYMRQGYSSDAVRNDALTSLGNRHRIFIRTNESLRREVLRIFDSTFAITYALEVVAIVVAMMGVATTLLTLTLDRRRDLAVLRLVGTARRQIVRMVVAEALMIAGVSQVIGLAVGMASVADSRVCD